MAEGAPLLREYRVKSLIEGSNPSLSARYAKRPLTGRFAYLAGVMVVDKPYRSTNFAESEFGQLPAGTGARSAEE